MNSEREVQRQQINDTVRALLSRPLITVGRPSEVRVLWGDKYRVPRTTLTRSIRSDTPFFYYDKGVPTVLLPESMDGKLSTEEWEPLIQSSIIYSTSPVAYGREQKLLGGLLFFALVIMSSSLTAFLVGGPRSSLIIISEAIATFAILVALYPISIRITQSRKLIADKLTTNEGKPLREVLEKIDSLHLHDVDSDKRAGFVTKMLKGQWEPSINQRIQNLKLNAR